MWGEGMIEIWTGGKGGHWVAMDGVVVVVEKVAGVEYSGCQSALGSGV
jgi:hypothetical protein